MAKRISRRLRKLAPRRALAFMVSAGENGAVELTLYAGRRSLSRELDARDVRTLVDLLTASAYLGKCGVPSANKALPLAQVVLDLQPGGLVRITSTCMGTPDASYAPMQDLRVAAEVETLVSELRDRLSRERLHD